MLVGILFRLVNGYKEREFVGFIFGFVMSKKEEYLWILFILYGKEWFFVVKLFEEYKRIGRFFYYYCFLGYKV